MKKIQAMIIVAALCLMALAVHAQPRGIPADQARGEMYFGEPATLETLAEMKASGQWTLEARTVLAQALMGEAGIRGTYAYANRRLVTCRHRDAGECFPNLDWKLIPWVLLKRWEDVRASGSLISFVGMVRAYSSPVRPSLATERRLNRAQRDGDTREVGQIMKRRFFQALTFDGSNLVQLRSEYGRTSRLDVDQRGWTEITGIVNAWGRGEIPNPCEEARHWDSQGAIPTGMIRVCLHVETLNAFHAVPRRRSRRRAPVVSPQVVEPS